MDRRALLMSLLAGSTLLGDHADGAEQGGAPDPSVYIPKAHVVEDRAFLHAFMDEFSFVDLVTTTPTLRITHIPSVLDRTKGRFGTIFGHISALNDQRRAITGGERAVVVFRGPHGYVSPGWLVTPQSRGGVPTWNFAVVHASGRMVPIDEPARKHALLTTLIKKYETAIGGTSYDFAALNMDDVLTRMKGIQPFELEIEALEGMLKLFQERPEPDRAAALPKLDTYRERSLRQFTEYFYAAAPK
ncbi:MAG: FMN-binding negative transcriptional regulator [Acidobacteria bacterium]|nr:FMN-binding negative transcriptional regulator [Acidobacteriota bacterium]